ncbi:MAG: NAD(P)-dependent oxidoreductase [Acidobacteriota bacterium]
MRPARVFIAGAAGTLGRPLSRALVARGHAVVGLTRDAARVAPIEEAGARGAVGDVLDADGLRVLLQDARPDVVVHALTALPPGGPARAEDLAATNRVRIDGTRHLIAAAVAAGARAVVAESFLAVYGPARVAEALSEEAPCAEAGDGPLRDAVLALRELERQLDEAAATPGLRTVALRFGSLYGPGVPATRALVAGLRAGTVAIVADADGVLPFVHLDDAVAALVAAVEHQSARGAFNVVDDEPIGIPDFIRQGADALAARTPAAITRAELGARAPVPADLMTWQIRLSNAKATRELEWRPRFPRTRDGWRDLAARRDATA